MANHYSWIPSVARSLANLDDPNWSYSQKSTFYFNRFKRKRLVSKGGPLKFILPKFELNVPEDAQIYLRSEKLGFIVVAPKAKKVLKFFLDGPSIEQLDREIEVLKKITNTDFEKYTNKFISCGHAGEGRWLLVEYMETTTAIDENYLFDHSLSLMTKMSLFYKVYGHEILSLESWLQSIGTDITKHPRSNDLLKVKELIVIEAKRVGSLSLVKSTLHADLHKENIMLTQEGEKIFDWEGTCVSIVLMDYFDFLRRFLNHNEGKTKSFWEFIATTNTKLPDRYVGFFNQLRSWHKENFGVELKEGQERLLFLIFALDRTCSLMRITPPRYTRDHLFEMKRILEVI